MLEGLSLSSEMAGGIQTLDRFEPIVAGLAQVQLASSTAPGTASARPQLLQACMQLINSIINFPQELEFRVHLRNEFMRTGLNEIWEVLRPPHTHTHTHTQTRPISLLPLNSLSVDYFL